MRRYAPMIRTRAGVVNRESSEIWETDNDRTLTPSLDVFCAGETARDSGLLDARGNPLMAIEAMDPIGFVRFVEH